MGLYRLAETLRNLTLLQNLRLNLMQYTSQFFTLAHSFEAVMFNQGFSILTESFRSFTALQDVHLDISG